MICWLDNISASQIKLKKISTHLLIMEEPLPDGAMRNCIEYVLRKKRQNRQKQKFVAKGKGLGWKSVKPKKK